MRPAALLFDCNGTLSDGEHIQCEIYQEIFAEAGKPLGQTEWSPGACGGRLDGRTGRAAG